MRQGLLSEPQASSGPAAMLLAVSRSPSSIPRRSPCPERCHLPLVSLDHIPPRTNATFLRRPSPSFSQNLKSIPDCIHRAMPPSSGVPQPHPPLKTSKTSPTASTPGAMPPSSGIPQPHPPNKTSKTPPTTSTPGPMPPSSGVPRPHPPNETSNVSPPASNAKSRRQKKSLAQT